MAYLRIQPLEDRIVLDGALAHDVTGIIAAAPSHVVGGDPNNLVVVANNITDGHTLEHNISPTKSAVLSYDYNKDTLNDLTTQINNTLAGKKVDSIAIATDGADGQFNLLNGLQINANTIQTQPVQDFLHSIANGLTPNGSLNILGCNVAQDAAGVNFLNALTDIVNSQGTHITVNASRDLTGSSALGGNWVLEYSSHPGATPVDASQIYLTDGTQNSWDHVLSPGVTITPQTGLVVTEKGGTDYFSVNLNSQPQNTVTLNLTISNGTEATFVDTNTGTHLGTTETLIFTTANWYQPQTIEIMGLNNGSSGPNDTFTISSHITSNTDTSYNPSMSTATLSVVYVSQDTNPYIESGVWNDLNGNGIHDPNEPGVAGIQVYLINNANSTIAAGPLFTNSTGVVVFSNIAPGSYHLDWVLPQSNVQISPYQIFGVFAPTIDSNAAQFGTLNGKQVAVSNDFNVIANTNVNHIDAGFIYPPANLTTHIWQDTNANGIYNAGEPSLAGLNVILHNTLTNVDFANATTDANGNVSFSNIPNGTYILEWQLPANDTFTLPNVPITGNYNSQAVTVATIGSVTYAQSTAFSIVNGANITNVNTGFVTNAATVVTTVWNDTNGNGVHDLSETGNASVVPQLVFDGGQNSAPTITSSLSNGVTTFTITGIAPGVTDTFHIVWTLPSGLTFTTKGVGSNAQYNSDANPNGTSDTFTVTNGQTIKTVNAGVITSTGTVKTFIWNDSNTNGVINSGEPGITGQTVLLVPVGGGPAITLTANPNNPGEYDATGVATGQYYLEWSIPSGGNTITLIDQGTNASINSDATLTGAPSGFAISNNIVTVTANGTVTTVNAGFVPVGATIISTAWNDTNANGIHDTTETGNANVTATLVSDTGSFSSITGTNVNGVITFNVPSANLTPGTTTSVHIEWIIPGNLAITTKGVGGSPQFNSDAYQSGSIIRSDSFTITNGDLTYQIPQPNNTPSINVDQSVRNFNIGLIQANPTLQTLVWFDANGNGIFDNGEKGIPGVKVAIYYVNSPGVSTWGGDVTTDANGIATFPNGLNPNPNPLPNLTPGSYFLEWQIPNGDQPTIANQGGNPQFNSNATIVPAVRNGNGWVGSDTFQINAGINVTTVNAGFITSTGTVKTFVWNDSNANGIMNAGEPGITGETVYLVPVGGGAAIPLTANPNNPGEYNATGVAVGQYNLEWSIPSGGNTITLMDQGTNASINSDATLTGAPSGFAISNQVVNVTANGVTSLVNAGFVPIGATIISTAWNDTNANGIHDTTETGNANITAILVSDTGSFSSITGTNVNGVTTFNVPSANLTPGTTTSVHIEWMFPSGLAITTKGVGGSPQFNSDAYQSGSIIRSDSFAIANGDLTYQIPQPSNVPPINVDQSVKDYNIGLIQANPTLQTLVWFDANGNGIFDNGEKGIPGVKVAIYSFDASGQSVWGGYVTTDANGIATFPNGLDPSPNPLPNLRAGLHFLEWQIPNGDQPTIANQGGNPQFNSNATIVPAVRNGAGWVGSDTFQINAGTNVTTVNAGFVASTGTVKTFVWNDNNANGIINSGEPGITGETVQLVPIGGGTAIPLTANPNNPGEFDATGVAVGQYYLEWSIPSGSTITLLGQGTNANANSDATLTGAPAGFAISKDIVNVTANGTVTTVNAGFVPIGATIVTTAWNDANGNGVYDLTETGNAQVTATLVNSLGNTIATGTNVNGVITFNVNSILPGSTELVHIVWTLPAGTTFTTKGVGGNAQFNSDASLVGSTIQSDTFAIANGQTTYQVAQPNNLPPINVNQSVQNFNIGVVTTSINSFAWNDLNSNGIQDPGEPGFTGLTVYLVPLNGSPNPTITLTDSGGGYYTASGIPLGQYHLEWSIPAGGYSVTFLNQGLNANINSNATLTGAPSGYAISDSIVNVTANSNITNVNAGFAAPPPPSTATVVTTAWNDTNGDGILNNGETLNSGVTAVLVDQNNNPVTATTTTNNGIITFTFTPTTGDTYQIQWTLPTNYWITIKGAGSASQVNSNASSSTNPIYVSTQSAPTVIATSDVFSVAPGATINTHNIGLVRTGTVTTFVWYDSNGNGIQNNTNPTTAREPYIPGLSITLRGTYELNAMSASNGILTFMNVPPGTYFLEWNIIAGYSASPFTAGQGGNTQFQSSGNPLNPHDPNTIRSNSFTLAQSQTITKINQGLVPTSISTFVWNDLNGNGIHDSNEPGVTGLQVYAYQLGNSSTLLPAVSMGNGYYTVFGSSIPTSTAIPTTPLTAGNQYFFVWSIPTNSVTTIPGANLPSPGQPNTTANTGTSDASSSQYGPTSVTSLNTAQAITGQNVDTVDLGIGGISTITTKVWYDANGNGVQDSGEPGISGANLSVSNVFLYRFDASGATQKVVGGTTSNSGILTFGNLPPGTYFIEWQVPIATDTTNPFNLIGGHTSITAPNGSTITSPDGTSYVMSNAFTVIGGQKITSYNLGIAPTTVSTTVWNDLNGNGIRDSGEPGINGLIVTAHSADYSATLTAYNTGSGIYTIFGNSVNPLSLSTVTLYNLTNDSHAYTLQAGDQLTFHWTIPSNYTTTLAGTSNVAGTSQAHPYQFAANVISPNFAYTGYTTVGIADATATATAGAAGTNTDNVDVGFAAQATMNIPIWVDTNGTGLYNSANDPSLYDYLLGQGLDPTQITVQLVANWGAGNITVPLSGLEATFTKLPVGIYYLNITFPSSYVNNILPTINVYGTSTPLAHSNDSDVLPWPVSSPANANVKTSVFTLPPNNTVAVGAGFTIPSGMTIQTTLWQDNALNGILNTNNGISGQQLILLYNQSGGATVVNVSGNAVDNYTVLPDVTVTDLGNGNYQFHIPATLMLNTNIFNSNLHFQILYQTDTNDLMPTIYHASGGTTGTWSDANPNSSQQVIASFTPDATYGTYFVNANNATYGNSHVSVASRAFTTSDLTLTNGVYTGINAGLGAVSINLTYYLDVNQNNQLDTAAGGTFDEPIITSSSFTPVSSYTAGNNTSASEIYNPTNSSSQTELEYGTTTIHGTLGSSSFNFVLGNTLSTEQQINNATGNQLTTGSSNNPWYSISSVYAQVNGQTFTQVNNNSTLIFPINIYSGGVSNVYVGVQYAAPSQANFNQQWATAWTQPSSQTSIPGTTEVNFYLYLNNQTTYYTAPRETLNSNGYAFWAAIPVNNTNNTSDLNNLSFSSTADSNWVMYYFDSNNVEHFAGQGPVGSVNLLDATGF